MRDTANSQYDSFLYWRLPIPELDLSELVHLGLADGPVYPPKGSYGGLGTDWKKLSPCEDEEEGLLQYNSFNFWRAPLPSVGPSDFDLI
ncbi:protein AF1q [Pogona vitticeps]|uniref:Protein AF1q n=1 Tax=Pogona vitticeps TaxID=103695 RepID=A0ABM5F4S7_9SAUR